MCVASRFVTVLVPGALAMFWIGRSSASAAMCFGFWPHLFGGTGVIGSSSINCDLSSGFVVGAFLRLAHVFVFSDSADTSLATDLVFLVDPAGGIGEVEV
jgi:hypothetical protein